MEALKTPAGSDPAARYERLVTGWHEEQDDRWLLAAYEFGREMHAAGFGVLDMTALHSQALGRLIADADAPRSAALVDAACRIAMETLASFEMTHRGFREANVALRASEERYRELFENANDIIFTTDLNGTMTSLNHAGLALKPLGRTHGPGLDLTPLIEPEFLARARSGASEDPASPGTRTRYETEIALADGRHIPLEVSTRVIHIDGKAVGIQGIARDVTDRRQAEAALRHLNQWLEEKASRIAHGLHDEAGQLLASVYLRVAEIAKELPPPQRQKLGSLRDLLDQVDDQIRRLAHELRPTLLDDLGLLPACEFLANGVSRRAMVNVSVRGSSGGRLPTDVETALYRVTQEALTNARKHAKASAISIEFERNGGVISGRVRDDGVGFDTMAVMGRIGKRGLGLIGMRERLAALGGTVVINAAPGSGTTIEFTVPVER
jgi:two-component system sensor histidine kinase UhpB